MADLFRPSKGQSHAPACRGRIVAKYAYRDERGVVLFEVVRFEPKNFRQRRPDGKGGWIWNTRSIRRVPYRLPELLAAVRAGETVYVVEGEKDVERLVALGFNATTNPGGVGKWLGSYSEFLRGADVVVIPDADEAGSKHANGIAYGLFEIARRVRVLELPGNGKDASDWIAAGGTAENLLDLAEATADYRPIERPCEANARGDGPVLVRLSNVQPEPVEWIWPGRIARGKLTLLVGDPGLGKSLLSLDIAARVSTGRGWPDGASGGPAGGIVLLSAEDDLSDTIRPRLDSAGADVEQVIALAAVREDGKERWFDLVRDLPRLEEALANLDIPRLVIVDPISAYLGDADSHNNTSIRGVLGPLATLAAKNRVAVLAVTHLRKAEGPALYRTMGSLAFVAAARGVSGVVRDPRDPESRILALVKSNLAAAAEALAFSIESPPGSAAPCLAWSTDPVEVDNIEELLSGAIPRRGADGLALAKAKAFLKKTLADQTLSTQELERLAKDAGIAIKTLKRARKELGLACDKAAFGGGWIVGPIGGAPEEGQPWPSSPEAIKTGVSSPSTEEGQVGPLRGADTDRERFNL